MNIKGYIGNKLIWAVPLIFQCFLSDNLDIIWLIRTSFIIFRSFAIYFQLSRLSYVHYMTITAMIIMWLLSLFVIIFAPSLIFLLFFLWSHFLTFQAATCALLPLIILRIFPITIITIDRPWWWLRKWMILTLGGRHIMVANLFLHLDVHLGVAIYFLSKSSQIVGVI